MVLQFSLHSSPSTLSRSGWKERSPGHLMEGKTQLADASVLPCSLRTEVFRPICSRINFLDSKQPFCCHLCPNDILAVGIQSSSHLSFLFSVVNAWLHVHFRNYTNSPQKRATKQGDEGFFSPSFPTDAFITRATSLESSLQIQADGLDPGREKFYGLS